MTVLNKGGSEQGLVAEIFVQIAGMMGTELLVRPCCLGSQNAFQNEWPERFSEGGRRSVKGTLGT